MKPLITSVFPLKFPLKQRVQLLPLDVMNATILLICSFVGFVLAKYEPSWKSLESRPLPEWYDEAKFGIFCHWGVYSVPAIKSEWMWWYWKGPSPDPNVVEYVEKNYPPGTTYADFAKEFKAELFDANEFARVVKSAGAKYFVFTSKHVEGFTMWPNAQSWNWNSVDVGPKQDIVGHLSKAFKEAGLHFGLYFCQYEWFNPIYLNDCKHNTTVYSETVSYPQLIDLVNRYEPDIVWSDGEYEQSTEYWKSLEFLAWLYNESPVRGKVVVNDRWGIGTMGKHGGYLTFHDHFDPGRLIERKWENCMTMDSKSWGNRRDMKLTDVISVYEIIVQLARTISCGGNLLLNVGPDNHGRIPLIFQDRLKELGSFLTLVSEAIYSTKPWIHQSDENNVWYTSRYRSLPQKNRKFPHQYEAETIIYAWILNVTHNDIVLKNVKPTNQTKITFLGTSVSTMAKEGDHTEITTSDIPWLQLPRSDVIVLKIERAATVHKKTIHHHHRKLSSKNMELL